MYSLNWTCLACVVLLLNYQQHPSFSEAVRALQHYDVMLWRVSVEDQRWRFWSQHDWLIQSWMLWRILRRWAKFQNSCFFYRTINFNILTGAKALAARVKPVNIPICHPRWTVMILIQISKGIISAFLVDFLKQIMAVSFLRFLFNSMSLRYPTWLKALSCGYIVWFSFNLWFVCSLMISE